MRPVCDGGSWIITMRVLADALERSPVGDTPSNQSLIAKARTLAYRAEAQLWLSMANAASPACEPEPPSGEALKPKE